MFNIDHHLGAELSSGAGEAPHSLWEALGSIPSAWKKLLIITFFNTHVSYELFSEILGCLMKSLSSFKLYFLIITRKKRKKTGKACFYKLVCTDRIVVPKEDVIILEMSGNHTFCVSSPTLSSFLSSLLPHLPPFLPSFLANLGLSMLSRSTKFSHPKNVVRSLHRASAPSLWVHCFPLEVVTVDCLLQTYVYSCSNKMTYTGNVA